MVPFKDVPKIEKYCNKKTKMMFLETPTNPTLRCVDLAELAKVGHRFGRDRGSSTIPLPRRCCSSRLNWDAMWRCIRRPSILAATATSLRVQWWRAMLGWWRKCAKCQ